MPQKSTGQGGPGGLAVKSWLHLSPVRVPLGLALAPTSRMLIYNLTHLIVCLHERPTVPTWGSEGDPKESLSALWIPMAETQARILDRIF